MTRLSDRLQLLPGRLRKQDSGGAGTVSYTRGRRFFGRSAAGRTISYELCGESQSAPSTLRTRRVTDKRVKRGAWRGGQQCNFYIYYEVDDEEYEDEAEYGWVLLAAAPEAAAVGRRVRAGAAGVRSTTPRWRCRCTFLRAGARGRPRFLGTVDENERRDFLMRRFLNAREVNQL